MSGPQNGAERDPGDAPAQLTRQELATASAEVWARWLRSGVLAFNRRRNNEDGLRAFVPLAVHPAERYPAGKLSREIALLTRQQTRIPAKACEIVLKSWSFVHESWREAAFVLDIATRLGAVGLFTCCIELLRKTESLSPEDAEMFASTMIMSAAKRFSAEQVIELGREIGYDDLWTPALLLAYVTLFKPRDLRDLPRVILEVAPIIKDGPHDGYFSKPLARRLDVLFDRTELEEALKPLRGEAAIVDRFRRTLAAELCLGLEGPEVDPALLGEDIGRRTAELYRMEDYRRRDDPIDRAFSSDFEVMDKEVRRFSDAE